MRDKNLQVIGVLKDYHQESLQYDYNPIIFYPEQLVNMVSFSIKLKAENAQQVLTQAKQVWRSNFPQSPLQFFFLDEQRMSDSQLIDQLRTIVGPQGLLTDKSDVEPYVQDWRGIYVGETAVVVRPASTEEVAAVVKACGQSGTPVVPQGGNTGMCMASVPRAGRNEIVLSLGRMNRIRDVDALNNTLTAEAGVVLANI